MPVGSLEKPPELCAWIAEADDRTGSNDERIVRNERKSSAARANR